MMPIDARPRLLIVARTVLDAEVARALRQSIEEADRDDDHLILIASDDIDVYQLVEGRWELLPSRCPSEAVPA
jgi:uncharacterized metal-binding protein YceD (DUF177 family)